MNGPSGQEERSILGLIREGMDVYDARDQKIGTVKEIYFGATGEADRDYGVGAADADDPSLREPDTFFDNLVDAFGTDLPDTLRNRLMHNGFVQIDSSGFFSSDRYALPDQISAVAEGRVILSINDDGLISI